MKQDYILMRQKERMVEQGREIQEAQEDLDQLTMKIEDIETMINEVSEAAYDKAVEAVSEIVTEETRNSDFGIIMDFRDHDVDADRRLSDKAKSVVKHVLGDLMEKFRGMTSGITARLDRMLHDPEIKERQMKPIRETARKSLLADLRAKKVEADQLNRSRRSKMTRSLEAER